MMARILRTAETVPLATYMVRRRAWQEQRIAFPPVVDITHLWLRNAVTNEPACCSWPRNGGYNHGR